MATGLESRKAATAETAVERQLAEVCRQIRWYDVSASLLLLGAVVGGYALVFGIFDLSVGGADSGWPVVLRWLAYLAFLGVVGRVLVQVVQRLTRPVNPYYAAQRLETTVADAKNSLINWLDLRDEPLPPALRKTLGGKAAHDLDEADPEQAVERGPTWMRLALFGAVLLGLLVLGAARPGQFFSLLRRGLLPFYESRLVEATRITLIRPEAGDVVVTEKQALVIVAQIDGRVPDANQPGAPALLYRYQAGDKWVTQPLQQDGAGTWTTRLLPDQLGSTGLWFKLSAGAVQTPAYQVTVRAQPFVERYEITYQYRPYLKLPAEEIAFPNQQTALPFIKRHRGTEVTLAVRTNRTLQAAGLTLVTGKTRKELPTQLSKTEPQAFRGQWVLEQSGDLFVSFTSVDGEVYRARVPIPVDVLTDAAPTAVLTRPAQNVALPANGTLAVEGSADDDLGLKELTLRLEKLEAGKAVPLQPLPYRPGQALEEAGQAPAHVDYLDMIKLDELRSTLDLPIKLQPGAVVRYWLEATDTSDYPDKAGQVGKSQAYEIKILPADDEDAQKQLREQAASKLKQQRQQQEQKLAKQQQAKQQTGAQPEANRAEQLQKQVDDDLKKLQERCDQPDQKGGKAGNQGDAKGNDPQPAENKPGNGANGEGGAPSPEPKEQKPADAKQAGNSKEGGQAGAPQPGDKEQQPGRAKDAGNDNSKAGETGQGGADQSKGDQSKDGGPQSNPMAGAGKDGPQQPGDPGMGKGDGAGDGGSERQAAGKDGGPDRKAPMPADAKGGGDEAGDGKPSGRTKPGDAAPKAPPGEQPPQGVAKSDAAGERSISKEKGQANGKQSNDPRLKAEAEKRPGEVVGAGTGEAKTPPNGAKKDVPGVAKDDATPPKAEQKTPTAQDVEHMKELMQQKGGLADLGTKALEQMAKEAPDPKVRDLAKQALDEAGPKSAPDAGKPNPGKANSDAGKPMPGGKTPGDGQGEPTSGKPPENKLPPSADAKPGTTPGGSPDGKVNSSSNPSGKGSRPGSGAGDDITADPARKDLARFGGNLQLEDFIKRATPEYRAKNGISDADWQRLLAHAAEYDALLRKLEKQPTQTPRDGRAGAGGVGSVGPTPVQINPGAVDPTDAGRAEAPPELLDALSRFRSSPGSPKR